MFIQYFQPNPKVYYWILLVLYLFVTSMKLVLKENLPFLNLLERIHVYSMSLKYKSVVFTVSEFCFITILEIIL